MGRLTACVLGSAARGFSAMELSLPDTPFGVSGGSAHAATHPGQSCRHRRRRNWLLVNASPDLPPSRFGSRLDPLSRLAAVRVDAFYIYRGLEIWSSGGRS